MKKGDLETLLKTRDQILQEIDAFHDPDQFYPEVRKLCYDSLKAAHDKAQKLHKKGKTREAVEALRPFAVTQGKPLWTSEHHDCNTHFEGSFQGPLCAEDPEACVKRTPEQNKLLNEVASLLQKGGQPEDAKKVQHWSTIE